MYRVPDASLLALQAIGLQVAVPLGPAYEDRAPPGLGLADFAQWARGGLLLLSGGPSFFEAFQREGQPYANTKDPLDAWTRDRVEAFIVSLGHEGIRAEARYPFLDEREPLPFLQIGQLAGVGATSLFGLTLHPRYGSFVAYRALVLFDRPLEDAPSFDTWDPCSDCPAPCIDRCPPGAVTRAGWALSTCVEHRRLSDSCEGGCLSRLACPVGSDQRPSDEALRFHQAASRHWIRGTPEEGPAKEPT